MLRTTHPTRPRASARGGFTLLETMIGISVLMVGLLALTSTSFVAHTLSDSDTDRRAAGAALSSVIEDITATANRPPEGENSWAETMVAAYGAGGDPGPTFDVPGLTPWQGLASVGSIEIVTDETLEDAELEVELGMPRDLDNDAVVGDTDVSSTATLLPVIVRLQWTGRAGDRELVQGFYVMGL